ncbi:MAG: ubiquinol-cytochrome c reductase iron-sulfur subunit [Planctomycetes bacterium]|nr:ubiquinol-cytochrome c reductase iron-sulfur subunit [Planctomycetota bacterium]
MSETKSPTPASDAASKKAAPAPPKTPVAPAPPAAFYEGQTTRRGFVGLVAFGWATFSAALAFGGGLLTRFLFPNVSYEPPQSFKLGFPSDFPVGVDERFKARYNVWIVKGYDPSTKKSGFYALSTVCTHLGCTPNWLLAESKFKCPCHGSGFQPTGVNFEGPAPRPLERFAIRLADDGQILVDKNRKFQQEKGEWASPDSFLIYSV